MTRDIANNIKATPGYAGGTISTNTDTVSGVVIDTQGFDSVAFLTHMGTYTDGTYVQKIRETDNADGSTGAVEVGSYQVQQNITASNTVRKVACKPTKRYVVQYITSTAVTTGVVIKGSVAVLGGARNAPVS